MIRFGFDIGIGSVGWAVVSCNKTDGGKTEGLIEDSGVRIFESGEDQKNKDTSCRKRRGFRSVRRLERRKQYRRTLLLAHFRTIGLCGDGFFDALADCRDADVYRLKVDALDRQISEAELYKCLIHTCNHRGYRDFYDGGETGDAEEGANKEAADKFTALFRESGCRTVSEYLCRNCRVDGFVRYRNRKGKEEHRLIDRGLLKDEAREILTAQSRYYPALTAMAIENTLDIIFRQRDFEDGPGNSNDKTRRYHGFLETVSYCRYYPEEQRGHRLTPIADVFAFVNVLSQCSFTAVDTGEIMLDRETAKALIDAYLQNGGMTATAVKKFCKERGYEIGYNGGFDPKTVTAAAKFLPLAKKAVETAGYAWDDLIREPQFDTDAPSVLHTIGKLISIYQTPRRRTEEMKKAGIDERLREAFSGKKCSGTANVSYRYMRDAIEAFTNGDIYGNFQARLIKAQENAAPTTTYDKLPPTCFDDDIRNNRVVFRAVNETRKLLNTLVGLYGAPGEVVIEVASDLGRSFAARDQIRKAQNEREKATDTDKKTIAGLLSLASEKDVSQRMLDVYRLYREQEGKSLYSGKELGELPDVLRNVNGVYEIDHIVPYSLILDNTLENRVLVYRSENQHKGQNVPLAVMSDDKAREFIARVNVMAKKKANGISRKKYAYLMLPDLYSPKARDLLKDWKSRNINDTRYITKYVAEFLKKYLRFDESTGGTEHVLTVKGALTSHFRREWFRGTVWGSDKKMRENYLNHALDALVLANLSLPFIEIGADYLRIRHMRNDKEPLQNVEEEITNSVKKMQRFYGFTEYYTRLLLGGAAVPSIVSRLREEVAVRFGDVDENGQSVARSPEEFRAAVNDFYTPFTMPRYTPHPITVSMKPERKYAGGIADENFVKIVKIDGEDYKIKRKAISDVTPKDLGDLYTGDVSLVRTLEAIFAGKDEKYTVGQYMKENGLKEFRTDKGQPVRSVSVKAKFSNFYRVEKGDGNYENLGMLKYYCLELYRNVKGELGVYALRYVDLVKTGGKLYQKPESRPADYAAHLLYVYKNDYLRVYNKKGLKFEGYYQSVYNINQGVFCFKLANASPIVAKTLSAKDTVRKIDVTLTGEIRGEIKCSEPFALLPEKD